jgi:hypothetical protein
VDHFNSRGHFDQLVPMEPDGFGADKADCDTAKAVAGWV